MSQSSEPRRVIPVSGRISAADAPELQRTVHQVLDGENRPHVEVDFSGLEAIGAQGLHVLQEAYQAAHAAGGSLTVVNVPPNIESLLKMVGMVSLATPPELQD